MKIIDSVYPDEKISDVRNNGFLELRAKEYPTWCPGCGYFGIHDAFLKACVKLKLKSEEICSVSGIGCSGRFPVHLNVYGFHTLHGRSIPVACGVKLANPALKVFAIAGDGDSFGIGAGHLPHAARRNVDITFILFDNSIYGLTKGQSSPLTPFAQKTNSHKSGNPDMPLNPVKIMLAYETTFVARGFAGDPEGLVSMIEKAVLHKGFSFIHVISPCVEFDKINYTWKRLKDTFTYVENENHNPQDKLAAMAIAESQANKLGVIYHNPDRYAYTGTLQIVKE